MNPESLHWLLGPLLNLLNWTKTYQNIIVVKTSQKPTYTSAKFPRSYDKSTHPGLRCTKEFELMKSAYEISIFNRKLPHSQSQRWGTQVKRNCLIIFNETYPQIHRCACMYIRLSYDMLGYPSWCKFWE